MAQSRSPNVIKCNVAGWIIYTSCRLSDRYDRSINILGIETYLSET
ncbi:MAG: hypothetical protein RM368_24645 [Nostoc sp. DedSLP03]|nr:hypothetical protein [Nostoc sp. DedSLP03]